MLLLHTALCASQHPVQNQDRILLMKYFKSSTMLQDEIYHVIDSYEMKEILDVERPEDQNPDRPVNSRVGFNPKLMKIPS